MLCQTEKGVSLIQDAELTLFDVDLEKAAEIAAKGLEMNANVPLLKDL